MEGKAPYIKGYSIVPDTVYGFDYAVYKDGPEKTHTHSIALIKAISS